MFCRDLASNVFVDPLKINYFDSINNRSYFDWFLSLVSVLFFCPAVFCMNFKTTLLTQESSPGITKVSLGLNRVFFLRRDTTSINYNFLIIFCGKENDPPGDAASFRRFFYIINFSFSSSFNTVTFLSSLSKRLLFIVFKLVC